MRNFPVRTHVNEIEAMYERARVNVKVDRGSTFTLSMTLHALSLLYARKIYVLTHAKITRQWKSNLKEL